MAKSNSAPVNGTLVVDLKNQSEIDEEDVRSCSKSETAEFDKLLKCIEIRSLDQILYMGLKESGDGPCFGKLNESGSSFTWLSYSQVLDKVKNLSSGLRYLALTGGERYNLGIWISSGMNSVIAEYACYAGGLIAVPLDDTLTPLGCASIINELNIGCIILETADKVQAIISQAYNLEPLKYVVMMDSLLESYRAKAHSFGITVKTCDELYLLGENDPVPFELTKDLNDVAIIVHTNGTTGDPKKVPVTHRSILYNSVGINTRLSKHKPNKSDIMFSYLPRIQLDERCMEVSLLMAGGRIGFSSHDIISAWKEVRILKPTILIILPKLVKLLKDKLLLAVRGRKIREWLVRRSLSSPVNFKVANNDAILRHIRSKIGGKIRLIITTTSHIPRDLVSFLRISLGCKVCTSYGLKELAGPCTLSYPDDEGNEHVGVPLPMVHIRIVNQELYRNDKKWGQIFIKKPAIETKLTNNNASVSPCRNIEEIWIPTDDVGFWRPNGTLEIVGHSSEVIKISPEIYLPLEKNESILSQSQFVEDLFIIASNDNPLSAIVVPNKEMVQMWCCENHIRGPFADLCENKRTKEEILSDLQYFGRKYGFQPYEHLHSIKVICQPFSTQSGLISGVLTNRRKKCQQCFTSNPQKMCNN